MIRHNTDIFQIPMTAYIPHAPTPKQFAALLLPHQEVFYGGAAGGGKSDWLLMGALQYVDVPKYSALILRKTLTDADKPGSIMYRAREWLSMTDAVPSGNAWKFPSGAILTFGQLCNIGDAFKYQSAEYQYIGADEITQLNPLDLSYVCRTRLRRTKCPKHKNDPQPDPLCSACLEFAPLSRVPLRIRTASNPGGQFHTAVRDRYRIKKIEGKVTPTGHQLYAGTHPDRPHIPAFIEDNPYLDQAEYNATLEDLGETDPVTFQQIKNGNWGISAEGRFKLGWLKRYEQVGNWFSMGYTKSWREEQLETFMVIDPAASTRNLPGKEEVKKRNPSHSALTVWSINPDGHLMLRKAVRHQKEVPETKKIVKELYAEFPAIMFVGMELSTMSTHLFQIYQNEGMNMRAFTPYTGDKVARSVDASNRMYNGRIWYPKEESAWLTAWEDEIFTWTGDPIETDDQVDCQSYASIYCSERGIHDRKPTSDMAPSMIEAESF